MIEATDITFLFDRSKSMEKIKGGMIKGFNELLGRMLGTKKSTLVSLAEFDYTLAIKYEEIPIAAVQTLSPKGYVPGGPSGVLDALGLTIETVGNRLGAMKEGHRPNRVIVVIVTDGTDTFSTQFPVQRIKYMVETQRSQFNWKFIWASNNRAPKDVAEKLGIDPNRAIVLGGTDEQVVSAFDTLGNLLI